MKLREVHSTYRAVAGAPVRRPQIQSALDAARLIAPLVAGALVEHFGVLSLDTKHRAIGWDVTGVGTLDSCLVHPRDIFRVAIQQNAAAVILAHNHPSGDSEPSADDHAITRRLVSAGEILGIQVLDHVVLGDGETFYSFRERGQM